MIEAGLCVSCDGEDILTENTSFPILPLIGQTVSFWRGRELAMAVVDSVGFTQKSDGSFGAMVTAELVRQ